MRSGTGRTADRFECMGKKRAAADACEAVEQLLATCGEDTTKTAFSDKLSMQPGQSPNKPTNPPIV